MREKILELERVSRQLDPGPEARKELLAQVQAYSETFLNQLPGNRAYVPDRGVNGFVQRGMGETPLEMPELLAFFREQVDSTGIATASGGHLGYIPGGGLYPSALGDFLADISNRYSGVSFAGPGAARMEMSLIRWMCELVGYPNGAGGDLTSGGSMATLSALVTARDAHDINLDRVPKACLYITSQAHHCIDKALKVAGLKSINKRIVPTDTNFRMDTGSFQEMIQADRAAGLIPWLVVGSAGTTDVGAVDPIESIAAIARRHQLWFHLDAAYGGFFVLCPEGRERLRGMALADSIVLDPHKGLSLPYGSGAVLIRERRLLAESNAYYAHYMQDAKKSAQDADSEDSPAEFSAELSRPFRGPRLWFPLQLFGLAAFRAYLAEKLWLARYFHERLSNLEGFETGPFPDLSIVTYRYLPRSGDVDEFNRKLHAAVLADGRVFISTTRINGHFTLRMAVLSFRTHLDTIDYLLALLPAKAAELDCDGAQA